MSFRMLMHLLTVHGYALAMFGFAACSARSDGETAGDSEFGFATGPLMRPGEDCDFCHRPGSQYETAPHWSLAGTVYPRADSAANAGLAGVKVVVSAEGGGEVLTLTTNAAGNFYTDAQLPKPYWVALEYQGERIEMPCPPPSGGCAKCHRRPPNGFAPGRLFIPQGRAGEPPRPFDCDAWMPEDASL
jgi:hypothetical protein